MPLQNNEINQSQSDGMFETRYDLIPATGLERVALVASMLHGQEYTTGQLLSKVIDAAYKVTDKNNNTIDYVANMAYWSMQLAELQNKIMFGEIPDIKDTIGTTLIQKEKAIRAIQEESLRASAGYEKNRSQLNAIIGKEYEPEFRGNETVENTNGTSARIESGNNDNANSGKVIPADI